jgi:hypothetical protein
MLNFQLPILATVGIAALVPTIVGFIWYNPKFLGKAWMEATGLTQETAQKGFNMPLVFGLSLFLSFLLAFSMASVVIHQMGLFSMMKDVPEMNDPNSVTSQAYHHLMSNFSGNYRSFKHGALHGTLLGVFTILPIIATSAMFERKSFKYIAINAGYWIVSLAIMGAIICHFAAFPKVG